MEHTAAGWIFFLLTASVLPGCNRSQAQRNTQRQSQPLDVVGCVERDGSGVMTLRVIDVADATADTQAPAGAAATDSAGGTSPRVEPGLIGTTTTAGANWVGSRALQVEGMDLSKFAGQRVHASGSLAASDAGQQRWDQVQAAHGVPYRKFTVTQANPVGGSCPAPANSPRSAEPPT
jgi:hypothetical protein